MCNVMAFVMQADGHNPNFVQWLAEGWSGSQADARLDVVVTPSFAERQAELCQSVAQMQDSRIQLIPLAEE